MTLHLHAKLYDEGENKSLKQLYNAQRGISGFVQISNLTINK